MAADRHAKETQWKPDRRNRINESNKKGIQLISDSNQQITAFEKQPTLDKVANSKETKQKKKNVKKCKQKIKAFGK